MIAAIRLQQFRSYKDRQVDLSPEVNIVAGPNASGKTNLLEAIVVSCRGASYRAPDSELIMHNKDWSRIDAESTTGPRTVKLTRQNGTDKEFLINNKTFKRLSFANQIPIVLFEPNHLLMLSGSPELRRSYLDGILELIKPGYKKTKNDFIRTLKQRNSLLKSGRANPTTLFPWNVRLSHLGGLIAASRAEVTLELNENISSVYTRLSNSSEKITLEYKTSANIGSYESQLLSKLESSLELDLIRGFTSSGPHREDLEVLINNKLPAHRASRGELRTMTVALKILEAETIRSTLEQKPIILLDDVFSELDTNRTSQLPKLLVGCQSIITVTDLHKINLSNVHTIPTRN